MSCIKRTKRRTRAKKVGESINYPDFDASDNKLNALCPPKITNKDNTKDTLIKEELQVPSGINGYKGDLDTLEFNKNTVDSEDIRKSQNPLYALNKLDKTYKK
jgi:hypothetical protein